MSIPHQFGGSWTEEKLERVRKYLCAYTTIFKTNPKARKLHTIYVDAFAGTGYRARKSSSALGLSELTDEESQSFLKGSARIALDVLLTFSLVNLLYLLDRSERWTQQRKSHVNG